MVRSESPNSAHALMLKYMNFKAAYDNKIKINESEGEMHYNEMKFLVWDLYASQKCSITSDQCHYLIFQNLVVWPTTLDTTHSSYNCPCWIQSLRTIVPNPILCHPVLVQLSLCAIQSLCNPILVQPSLWHVLI